MQQLRHLEEVMSSPGEKCELCKFFIADNNCCVRYPPTPVFYGMARTSVDPTPRPQVMGHFAPVGPNNWCGEWVGKDGLYQ